MVPCKVTDRPITENVRHVMGSVSNVIQPIEIGMLDILKA